MPSIDSFRTRRGVARFTGDSVLFEESFTGYFRALYRGYWQSEYWRRKAIFIGYIFCLLFAIGWTLSAVWAGDVLLLAGLFTFIVALLALNYLQGFRSPDRIQLDNIEDISSTRGQKGLTRPRLVITYTNDGSQYKRRVNLPSLYTDYGQEAFDCAAKAFDERGFDTD
ncbi:hypothetical protein [Haloferax profundi]|uniref:Uncharacterized protein n=1 Tax=Haloferax profundi TaxID=1544718 RepID=A0A0W1RD52_9EURY|nr:hypothetical protein [Haloferax profundi]KTG11321.1 hypothetical protein AUR66_20080 [Haloferax profundi]